MGNLLTGRGSISVARNAPQLGCLVSCSVHGGQDAGHDTVPSGVQGHAALFPKIQTTSTLKTETSRPSKHFTHLPDYTEFERSL